METRHGSQTVTDAKITPAILEQYFNSIQEPFRETRKGLAEEAGGSLTVFVVGFVFSLIPVIPYLFSKLSMRLFGPRLISFRTIHFQLSSFFFWWLTSFVISLSALVLASKFSGPSAEEKKRWLSPQQMRFTYCYGVVDEIGKYRTNQLGRHLQTARNYLEKTRESLRPVDLDLDEIWRGGIRFIGGEPTLISHGGGRRPKWYRLQPDTELILQGFRSLIPKLGDRLKDKKDLGAIQSVLTELASYLYTEIPELSDSAPQNNFDQAGMESLLRFARQIIELPTYQSEEVKQTPKERLSRKIISAGYKLTAPLVHQNVLVAFCSWYAVTLLLFCGGFYFAFRLVPSIKMDTTIVTAVVGGPIATAVTAVTIPRLSRNKKDKE